MKLPESTYVTVRNYKEVNYYTAAQMREYRNAALEEALDLAKGYAHSNTDLHDAIRALKEVQS